MIPRKIFTGFAKFQGIVSVNDFGLPIWLQELLQAPLCVGGALLAKGPNSSFAEAHSVLLTEPTHMEDEDEDEDQENEKEDERDGEECKMESRRESKQPLRMMDDVMRTTILSQCHARHWNVVCETRENVTCEGVLFTPIVGCSRLLSAVNDLTTTIFSEKCCHNYSTLSILMSKRPKQVSLFFDAAHFMNSEVTDIH